MNIGPISSIPQATALQHVNAKSKNTSDSDILVDNTASPQTPVETTPTESLAEAPQGVIQQLLDGHFKGVADVRLRINFHGQLAAIEHQACTDAVDGQAETFAAIAGPALSFVASDTGEEEAFQAVQTSVRAYDRAVESAFDTFVSGSVAGKESLVNSLKAAFDNFLAEFENTVATPANGEEPTNPVVRDDLATLTVLASAEVAAEIATAPAEAETNTALDELLSEMRASFETAIAELDIALQSTRMLPELSEPHGNGAAYGKFLAIYRDMNARPADEPAPHTLA